MNTAKRSLLSLAFLLAFGVGIESFIHIGDSMSSFPLWLSVLLTGAGGLGLYLFRERA